MAKRSTESKNYSVASYKQLSQELEQLLAWFEGPDFDIDQATSQYGRAMEVIASMEANLNQVENTVEQIRLKFSSA